MLDERMTRMSHESGDFDDYRLNESREETKERKETEEREGTRT